MTDTKYKKKPASVPMEVIGKLPPQSKDLEETVLGAMIIDYDVCNEVIEIIKISEAFYFEESRLIYEAIRKLVLDNKVVDLVTVSDQLTKLGNLEKVGGVYYLMSLSQKVASVAHVEYHARILLEKYIRRELIRLSALQQIDSYDETRDVFDVLEGVTKGIDHINDSINTGETVVTFPTAIDMVVKRIEMLSTLQGEKVSGVPTGFRKIDEFTGGWQNSDLIILGARPGMGKTSFVLKNVSEVARKGMSVGFMSLEMSIEQLAARIVAINTNFHLTQILKKGFEKDEYFITLQSSLPMMKDFPIYVDDRPGLTITQVMSKARTWKRKYDIKILFIDYLQLMSGNADSKMNREQEISTISRRLKHLAKELNIPVIALSQLSREVETRTDKRPRLSDLRESGSIEQDADIVMFLFRPEYYGMPLSPELKDMNANSELIFAKYRQGSLETKGLYFIGDKAKFIDPTEYSDDVKPNNNNIPF